MTIKGIKDIFQKFQNYFIPTNKTLRREFYTTIARENITRLFIISSFYFLFELKIMLTVMEARNSIINGIPFNMLTLNAIVIVISVLLLKRKKELNGKISHILVSTYCLFLVFWSARASLEQVFKTGSITMFILTLTATSAMFYRRVLVSLFTNVGMYLYFVLNLRYMTESAAKGHPIFPHDLHRTTLYIYDALLIMVICCVLAAIVFTLRLKVFLENKELKELALKDSMTNLMNHRTICESLKREIKQSQRYSLPLSILMIDIDHFKTINDTYGHQSGDVVIKKIAELLKNNFRETDFIGRYGGEEFLIILTNTDAEEALCLGERLRNSVEVTDFGISKAVTVSGGLMNYENETAEEMIHIADQALYKAKEKGRNRIIKS